MQRLQCLRLLLVTLVPTLTGVLAFGQPPAGETKPLFRFLIAPDKGEKDKRTDLLYLRPNVKHEVVVFLKNPERIQWKDVAVQLMDSNDVVLAQANLPALVPTAPETKLEFSAKAAVKEGAKDAPKMPQADRTGARFVSAGHDR